MLRWRGGATAETDYCDEELDGVLMVAYLKLLRYLRRDDLLISALLWIDDGDLMSRRRWSIMDKPVGRQRCRLMVMQCSQVVWCDLRE